MLSRFDGPAADTCSDDADVEPTETALDDLAAMAEAPEVPKLGSFEVMNRTIDIAQSALARHTLAAYPADLLIEVPRATCRILEFRRAVEVIAAGRELATQALDAFEREDDEPVPPAIEG
jgi:NTE family protein